MHAEKRGLLSAVLRARAGEGTACLSHQGTISPQLSQRIKEMLHLGAHTAQYVGAPRIIASASIRLSGVQIGISF